MFRFLFLCINNFGVAGIAIYLKLKLNRTKNINVPGFKYAITLRPVPEDKYTFREIFIKKEYEFDLPPNLIPKTIIDAGANIGLTSIYFATKYNHARIFSIEPDTSNFTQLKANSKPYERILPIQGALWHTSEMINIVDKGRGNRSFMIEQSHAGVIQGISVQNIMAQYNLTEIDIFKIDIEGSEKEVFEHNYDDWLPVTKCLVIELHDRMKTGCSKSVFSAISKFDFSMTIKGENLIFINNRYVKINDQTI